MTVDASLQIRKLPPSHITQLSTILEFSEQWKKLMAVIPSKLEKGNFQCSIDSVNPAKYNADHMRLIEAASVKYKNTSTEILFDEWGCSGRVLPTVGHLLHLLLSAELYRAADYVSERILCRSSVNRPSLGPAAKIPLTVNRNIEEDLNNIKVSSSLIHQLNFSSFNNNLDYGHDETSCIAQIVVTPDADELAQSQSFQDGKSIANNVAVNVPNGTAFLEEGKSNESDSLHSDITSSPVGNESIEHSSNEPYIPQMSDLLANSKSEISRAQSITSINALREGSFEGQSSIPNISGLNQSVDESDLNSNISSFNIPNLSGIINSEKLDDSNVNDDTLTQLENSNSVNENHDSLIPDLSGLNQSENLDSSTQNYDTLLPNLSGLNLPAYPESLGENDDAIIPNLSGLNQSHAYSENSITSSNNIPSLSISNRSSLNIKEINISSGNKQFSESTENSSSVDLPDISGLIHMSSTESYDTTSSNIQESGEILHINSTYLSKIENSNSTLEYESDKSMPNLNVLISESSRLTVTTFDSSKYRKCNSPLPNLTLTTHLPHYTFEKLGAYTNDFNENVFDGLNKEGRLLGSGAFGKVFLAKGILQQPVAVKKILLGNVEVVDVDDRITKHFINEVEVVSKFRHKNLVSVLGFSCDGSTYCLLYEFIPGGTLEDRLQSKEHKLTWQERLSIALGTANAITYLHTAFSSPLIHRDVKTANILLDKSNKPKLGDFGITTLLDQNMDTTTTVIGTSAYMAPEAMRGDISVKCDTFSFGVVLLELLTSLTPFDENRDGKDLITHVLEKCEDSIVPLLDTSIGSWSLNNINFGDGLFSIARQCIEEKKKRPIMVDVTEMLMMCNRAKSNYLPRFVKFFKKLKFKNIFLT